MDERIDILNFKGDFTGKTAMKSEAHKHGWFHPTVHIWFYTSDGKILLQQRGKKKDTHPLLWDVSVSGHVGTGENIELSAVREVNEEIGLTISKRDLTKIGVFKSSQKHHHDLLDCEFHHTFLCKLVIPFKLLKKQESEVEALQLLHLSKLSDDLNNSETSVNYVPHYKSYYKTIIKSIKERL